MIFSIVHHGYTSLHNCCDYRQSKHDLHQDLDVLCICVEHMKILVLLHNFK